MFPIITDRLKKTKINDNCKPISFPPKNYTKIAHNIKIYYVPKDIGSGVYQVICKCENQYTVMTKRNLN